MDLTGLIRKKLSLFILLISMVLGQGCSHSSVEDSYPGDFPFSSEGRVHPHVLEQLRAELGEGGGRMVELVLARHSWVEIGALLQLRPDAARMRWLRAVRRVQERLGMSPDPDDSPDAP